MTLTPNPLIERKVIERKKERGKRDLPLVASLDCPKKAPVEEAAAVRLFKELGIPTDAGTNDAAAQAIAGMVKPGTPSNQQSKTSTAEEALQYLLARARKDMAKGKPVDRFWFQSQRFLTRSSLEKMIYKEDQKSGAEQAANIAEQTRKQAGLADQEAWKEKTKIPVANAHWETILADLEMEKEIPKQSFETWLKQTRGYVPVHDLLIVKVPHVDFQHIEVKFASAIRKAIERHGFAIREVRFVVTVSELDAVVASERTTA